jgi:hypothetical protein
MQSSNKKVEIGAIAGLLYLAVTVHPVLAQVTSDNSTVTTPTQVITNGNSIPQITTGGTIIPSSSIPSTLNSSVSQFNQQSGGIQVNGYASTLTSPSCNGGCFFAITIASPATYGSGANLEAVVGVTIPLGSTDGGMGEVNRLNAEMQKYRTQHEIKLALSEKLAEALENGKTERATIIAMNLAPMLGYRDYQSLLKAVSIPKTTNPQIINR